MRHKHYGVWQPHTWKDYYLNVKHLALGLLAFGFEAGDKVLIIGDNAPQWYYAELAAQANHGVSVGLFSELLPSGDKIPLLKIARPDLPSLKVRSRLISFFRSKMRFPFSKRSFTGTTRGLPTMMMIFWSGTGRLSNWGKHMKPNTPGSLSRMWKPAERMTICAIIYTAGTTGAVPKGAVHTYRTLRAGADYLLQLDPWFENDTVVPYLPPVWINEQWIGIGCHLLSAGILNFAEASETQQRDSRETGPSIVFYGARLWESQAATVQARILGADAIKRFAFRLFMPVGHKTAELKYRRQKPGCNPENTLLFRGYHPVQVHQTQPGFVKCQNLLYDRGDTQPGCLQVLPCPQYSA